MVLRHALVGDELLDTAYEWAERDQKHVVDIATTVMASLGIRIQSNQSFTMAWLQQVAKDNGIPWDGTCIPKELAPVLASAECTLAAWIEFLGLVDSCVEDMQEEPGLRITEVPSGIEKHWAEDGIVLFTEYDRKLAHAMGVAL